VYTGNESLTNGWRLWRIRWGSGCGGR